MHRFKFRAITFARMLAVAILFSSAQIAWSQAERPQGVENFGRVTDLLYRGAQPTSSGFSTLQKMGIRIVVNFRNEPDETAAEKHTVESLGMKYVGIPWSAAGNPSDAQVLQFLDIVRANPQTKIFVHCKRGADRTGTMIAAYRVAVEHEQVADAVSEMHQFHYAHFFLPHLERFIDSLPHTLQSNALYNAYVTPPGPTQAVATAAAAGVATAIVAAP